MSIAKRPYRQRKRAKQAESTRQRIIDAMREALMAAPFVAISLETIAERAGVARSTIYMIFESRLGLFEAIERDFLERGGFQAIQAAFALPDAWDILHQCLAASVQLYVNDGRVWRALELQALIDPDAATSISQVSQGRIGGMRHLAQLLEQQGFVRPGVTVTEVSHILAQLTDFVLYEQLTLTLGLTPDQILAHVILIAQCFLQPH